jgi:hypothetical protein
MTLPRRCRRRGSVAGTVGDDRVTLPLGDTFVTQWNVVR